MEQHFQKIGRAYEEISKNKEFVIFLCGPTIAGRTRPANFRRKLRRHLEKENFRVVLGEDDGLREIGEKYNANAQINEARFLELECSAVVIIATSPGALCELGLFSYMRANGLPHLHFFVLLEKKHQDEESYINKGPVALVQLVGGTVKYVDYENADLTEITTTLKQLRMLTPTKPTG